jgi:hypothetical protein
MSLTEIKISELVSNQPSFAKPQIKLRTSSEPLSKQFPMRSRPTSTKCYDDFSYTERGDYLAWKVYDTLSSFDNIIEIANTSGISGNCFDLVVRTKDGYLRGIQVKTLARRKANEQYYTPVYGRAYPDQTLMIFANADYNRFAIAQWLDIKTKTTLSVNYLKVNQDPSFIMFNDITLYENHVYNQISKAVIINDIRDGITGSGQLIEYDFTRKVKAIAESFGIQFEYENTDGSPIDFYLDGQACQMKVTGIIKKLQYHFHISKTIDRKDCPYTQNDGIRYFIFAINEDIYLNNILIIPIQNLINSGHIKTDTQSGITSLCLPPPNFHKYHWSSVMWNNWEIIRQKLLVVNDPISVRLSQFGDSYVLLQPSCQTGFKYNFHINYSTFGDDKINDYIVILNDQNSQLYPNWIWIISKLDLIREKKFPTIDFPDRNIGISVPPPYYVPTRQNPTCWSTQYWQMIV